MNNNRIVTWTWKLIIIFVFIGEVHIAQAQTPDIQSWRQSITRTKNSVIFLGVERKEGPEFQAVQ